MRFGPKNFKKIGLWCLQVCTKTLRNFSVWLRRCWNLQDSRLIGRPDCCNNKKGSFRGKRCVSVQKTSKKLGFWCLQVCTKTLRNFTVWLRRCWNLQDARLIGRPHCCNNKKVSITGRKLRFVSKLFKKLVLGSSGLYQNASQFYCLTPMMFKVIRWPPK